MKDQTNLHPTGSLIDVGGYRLHIQCQGRGSPVAVMESGLGGNSLVWIKSLEAVGQFTQACAYDRAGYAWSDPAPADVPRTSQQIVAELRLLLVKAGKQPPYILLGHSSGAIHMLYYAHHFPQEVAGLVLVDPSHPEMFAPGNVVPTPETLERVYRVITGLGSMGLLRWLGPMLVKQTLPDGAKILPEETWQAINTFFRRKQTYETARRELQDARESFASARGAAGSLGDLPLEVLVSEFWLTGKQTAMKKTMQSLSQDHARLSSQGRVEIVKDCDHTNLPIVRADAVAEAVENTVTSITENGKE
jgi:pimeloyl-ACP methyl ester carboxylesterase